MKLLEPTEGRVLYKTKDGMKDLYSMEPVEAKAVRLDIQAIFQDPFSSLDPRMSVREIIAEPLNVNKIGTRSERTEKVRDLLERVGLSGSHMNRYPHEFSGGQRQRIGIARALALNPKLVVCDEPVSALDVSVQAQVLNLLSDLQEEFGLTYLFIAHDLSVVEHISDRLAVMYLGKIVEIAKAEEIYEKPKHPYSEALLAAIPTGDPRAKKIRKPLQGTVPSPSNPPSGCYFHTRCPYVKDICREQAPPMVEDPPGSGHMAACHFAKELDLMGYESVLERE